MSVSICFIYLGAPVLGVCMLMSIVSSSYIDPFIIVECPSLSFVIAFVLKSILSDMSIATPALFCCFHRFLIGGYHVVHIC